MKTNNVLLLNLALMASMNAQSLSSDRDTETASTLPTSVLAENTLNTDAQKVVASDDSAQEPSADSGQETAAAKSDYSFVNSFNSDSSEDSIISIVELAILKNPDHCCEVVKQAIETSNANEKLIARVVETAILAAPDQMRLIAQCAIAASPDTLTSIQLVLAKYDSAAGDGAEDSGKEVSAKGGTGKDVARASEQSAALNPTGLPGFFPNGLDGRLNLPFLVPAPPFVIPPVATDNDVP